MTTPAHRTIAEVGIGDRFDAQQRSEQDVVAARAQRRGGALAVGLGPGHQQAHVRHSGARSGEARNP